jgi:uncharacterized protein YjbI with pentapeptide repeats
MSQEIKIEKKASEVIQPSSDEDARVAIRTKQDLSGASLPGMQLKNLSTAGAILRKTDLSKADLSHSVLVNPNFYRANLHGTAMHNTILIGGDLVKTRFEGTDLHESALIGVNAELAVFRKANLRNAAIVSANLQDADFTGANLTDARLSSLNVDGADFTEVELSGARAHNVDWTKAKVPPRTLPAPLIELPKWAWSVLAGAFLGTISLVIYALIRKNHKKGK